MLCLAALVIGLSYELKLAPGWNKLALVWVNLDTGVKAASAITRNHPTPSAVAVKETMPAEKPAIKPAREAVETVAPTTQPQTITMAGSNITGARTNFVASSPAGTGGNSSRQDSGVTYPLYLEKIEPAYPEIARRRGYEGSVLLAAEILPTGRVGNIKIKKSSGYAILDQSAVESVKPWKFEPARKSGKPFTIWVELPIRFVLPDNNQS